MKYQKYFIKKNILFNQNIFFIIYGFKMIFKYNFNFITKTVYITLNLKFGIQKIKIKCQISKTCQWHLRWLWFIEWAPLKKSKIKTTRQVYMFYGKVSLFCCCVRFRRLKRGKKEVKNWRRRLWFFLLVKKIVWNWDQFFTDKIVSGI